MQSRGRRQCFADPAIVGALDLELFPPARCQPVLANRPAGVRHSGRRLDPALEQQLLQRRVQRALFYAELGMRQLRDALCDGVAVQRRVARTRRINIARVPGGSPSSLGIVFLCLVWAVVRAVSMFQANELEAVEVGRNL